jgi:hypothetical protein
MINVLNGLYATALSVTCVYYKVGSSAGSAGFKISRIGCEWERKHPTLSRASTLLALRISERETALQLVGVGASAVVVHNLTTDLSDSDSDSDSDDDDDTVIQRDPVRQLILLQRAQMRALDELRAHPSASVLVPALAPVLAPVLVPALSIILPENIPSIAPAHTFVPTTPDWPPAEPLPRRVPLSSIVRLVDETTFTLEFRKHAHDGRIKQVALDAFNNTQAAIAVLNSGPPSDFMHRTDAFRVRHTEIFSTIKSRLVNVHIDVVNAMLEYNRLMEGNVIMVTVPDQVPERAQVHNDNHLNRLCDSRPLATSSQPQPSAVAVLLRHVPGNDSPPRQTLSTMSQAEINRHIDADRQIVTMRLDYARRNASATATASASDLREEYSRRATANAARLATAQRRLSAELRPAVTASAIQLTRPVALSGRRCTVPGKGHLFALNILVSTELAVGAKKHAVANGAPCHSDDECTLCTVEYNLRTNGHRTVLNCGHEACASCVGKLASSRTKSLLACPYCRETVTHCKVSASTVQTKLSSELYNA